MVAIMKHVMVMRCIAFQKDSLFLTLYLILYLPLHKLTLHIKHITPTNSPFPYSSLATEGGRGGGESDGLASGIFALDS